MTDIDEPRRLGGELRLSLQPARTYFFQGSVYVVDVVGRLTVEALRETLDFVYRDPVTLRPHAVIFREGPGADYERAVLTFYQADVPRPMPVLVGVVTRRAGVRMIAMATALGFRALTGARLSVYEDLIGGLVDARTAVAQAVPQRR